MTVQVLNLNDVWARFDALAGEVPRRCLSQA